MVECKKFKTLEDHHDNMISDKDFERYEQFKGEGYQVEWTCKHCEIVIIEYYPYTGYVINNKDGNQLQESWN